jgi:hypothetical protein
VAELLLMNPGYIFLCDLWIGKLRALLILQLKSSWRSGSLKWYGSKRQLFSFSCSRVAKLSDWFISAAFVSAYLLFLIKTSPFWSFHSEWIH